MTMTTRRILLFLALLGALVAPSSVQAAPLTPPLELAYKLAVKHWGEPEGCVSIDRQIVPNGALGEHQGEATKPEPGEHLACYLHIIRELAAPRMWGRACAVMFHEVGHLNGFDHSADPRSLMYPTIPFVPSACWRTMLWLMNHPRFARSG